MPKIAAVTDLSKCTDKVTVRNNQALPI
uniref:Uncharacterized protein n=1 Tax=Anguilla anguilla TaxID=7936 RepID=A0A0E9VSS7_ANGAN